MLFNFLSEVKVPAGLCPYGASCLVVTASACLSCGRAVPVSASAVTSPVRTPWLRAGTRAVGLPHRRHPGHACGHSFCGSTTAPTPPLPHPGPSLGVAWGYFSCGESPAQLVLSGKGRERVPCWPRPSTVPVATGRCHTLSRPMGTESRRWLLIAVWFLLGR